jgi:aminocarboxymuconate-semialdehyde decarboxylase
MAGQVVDLHTHLVPRGWPDLATTCGGSGWPWLRIDSERAAMIMVGETEFRPIGAECWDAPTRLADMDADGVDLQVVSPTPVFFSYDRPAGQAVKVARIFNDLTLELTAAGGDRLVPFCQVPLQDPDAACAELDRCLAAGHAGVEISNHVGDRDLDDEGVVTFLQHCAAVGAPVFVHPWDMPGGPRLDRWMARWLAGMPAETHLSMLALVLGGVFDRVPQPCASASPTAAAASRSGSAGPTTPGTAGVTWYGAVRPTRRATMWNGSSSTPWCSGRRRCACWSRRSARTRWHWAATTRTRWGSGRSVRWSGTPIS